MPTADMLRPTDKPEILRPVERPGSGAEDEGGIFYCIKHFIGMTLLLMYTLVLRVWWSIMPIFEPIIKIAQSINPEDISISGLVEQATKLVLMVVLLWWQSVVAVWEVITWPFEWLIRSIREFFWKLEMEINTKPKTPTPREQWLTGQLSIERQRQAEERRRTGDVIMDKEETSKQEY